MAGAWVMGVEVFRAVRGYEPRLFIGGEEELVALDVLAAGHAIVYLDSLIVYHKPSPARSVCAQCQRRKRRRNGPHTACPQRPCDTRGAVLLHAPPDQPEYREKTDHAA